MNTIDEREVKIVSYQEDCLDKVKDILWVVFRIQDLDAKKTYHYISEGIKICNKLNVPIQKYKLLAYQGAMFEKEYLLEEALTNYTECADFFKRANDEWMYSNMLDSIAGIYSKTNREKEALNIYLRVIKICRKLEKPDELFLGLLNSISLALNLKRYRLAKNFYEELVKLESSLTFMKDTALIYLRYFKAIFEILQKEYEKAGKSIDEAIISSETKKEYQFEKAMCLALKVEWLYVQKLYPFIPREIHKIQEITEVDVTINLKEALTTLQKSYQKTKNYEQLSAVLMELYHIREREMISRNQLLRSDRVLDNLKSMESTVMVYIQDRENITWRMPVQDIVSITYMDRITTIRLSDNEVIKKIIPLTEFLNMLTAQNIQHIVRINRTQAVNLFYMESYNSSKKTLILNVQGDKETYDVAQRQEKCIKNYRL